MIQFWAITGIPGNTIDGWIGCAELAEEVIRTYPRVFNPFRNIAEMYDVAEGYGILRQTELVTAEYEFHEQLVAPHPAFSKSGRSALLQALAKLPATAEKNGASAAIYTCGGYIFTVGHLHDHFFLVDSHSIGADLGGNGNGILKVYPSTDSAALFQLCAWIWKRLQHSGVQAEEMQSLVFLSWCFCPGKNQGLSVRLIRVVQCYSRLFFVAPFC